MEQNHNESEQNKSETNNKELNESSQTKKASKRNTLSHITSGIFGGVTSAVIIIAMFTSNIIPFNEAESNINPIATENNSATNVSMTMEDNAPANLDELSKAVVGVLNLQQSNNWNPSEEAGSGSGIIYKKENGKAYVITNSHVVQDAQQVEIDLGGERIKAKLLGADALNDLAVLEIDGSKVDVVASLGSSDELEIGEAVFAIGNPLGLDFAGSVTKGIISGLDRSVEVDTNGDNQTDWVTEVIQTDAAINPGNSGGALVNTNGEVIGINSMKIARQAVEGIGFSIPVDAALPIVNQLEKNGEVVRPFIGISTVELNQVPQEYKNNITVPKDVNGGMVIANVQEHTPASSAGLKQFDFITKINDQEITSLMDLRKYMYSKTEIGDTVKVEIYRDGEQQIVSLELTERDS